MESIRVLLVGFGEMGRKTHFPTIYSSPISIIVGLVRASNQPVESKVPIYTSLKDALVALHPDLAVISTPHYFHYQQAKLCLEYNCNVLVEKPLTFHYKEAEVLARLASEKNRQLVVGLQRRYEGLARIYQQLKQEGKLGEIQLIHGLFAHRFVSSDLQGWRADPKSAGAGIVDDSAIHLIDLLLYFSGGKVTNLKAKVLADERKDLPHSFTCFFETDNGVTVSATGSYLSPVNSVQEEISIFGTKGSLFGRRFRKEWNTKPPDVFFKSVDGTEKKDFDLSDFSSGKSLPLEYFLKFLTGEICEKELLTKAYDTLETHRTIEMIRNHLNKIEKPKTEGTY